MGATTSKITLVLPSMSGTNGVLTATVGTSNGCGTAITCGGTTTYASQSTFTAVLASQGQAGANVVFTVGANAAKASVPCSVTVATGLTNANANQAANLASRTVAFTLTTANQPASVAAATIAASTAVTGAPTPSPTPSSTTVTWYVQSTVSLAGLTAATFTATAQTGFKEVIAAGAGGSYTSSDVAITGYSRRRALSVTYRLTVASQSAATTAATTLNTFMTGTTFLTSLQAKSGMSGVTGVTVTSSAAAASSTSSSGVASRTAISLMGLVTILVALRLA